MSDIQENLFEAEVSPRRSRPVLRPARLAGQESMFTGELGPDLSPVIAVPARSCYHPGLFPPLAAPSAAAGESPAAQVEGQGAMAF